MKSIPSNIFCYSHNKHSQTKCVVTDILGSDSKCFGVRRIRSTENELYWRGEGNI